MIKWVLQDHTYPEPVVSHVLATLAGVFGKLDLTQAYQQLPVDDATAEAHWGAFKVRHLQFGVTVAPGVFQNLMDSLKRASQGHPLLRQCFDHPPTKDEFASR